MIKSKLSPIPTLSRSAGPHGQAAAFIRVFDCGEPTIVRSVLASAFGRGGAVLSRKERRTRFSRCCFTRFVSSVKGNASGALLCGEQDVSPHHRCTSTLTSKGKLRGDAPISRRLPWPGCSKVSDE